MANSDSKQQNLITSHTVLVGLTPLIPIPLVDDLARTYFQRRLVRKMAEEIGQRLTDNDIKTLADEKSSGCLMGCLTMVLLYPVKKIFRKIFFFLEWKRAIDIASITYHQGYLLEYAFEQRWCEPDGPYTAEQVRAAIDATCQEAGTDPIKKAVVSAFTQSQDLLKQAAETVKRNLPIGRVNEQEVAQAAEVLEAEEARSGVTGKLETALAKIPPSYFQGLRERLAFHLQNMKRE